MFNKVIVWFETGKTVVNPHHYDCKLGSWIHGNGAERYGHLPSHQKIEVPHKRTHSSMTMAVQYLVEAWQVNPSIQAKILDSFTNVEKNSNEVTELLDGLIDEKKKLASQNKKH